MVCPKTGKEEEINVEMLPKIQDSLIDEVRIVGLTGKLGKLIEVPILGPSSLMTSSRGLEKAHPRKAIGQTFYPTLP